MKVYILTAVFLLFCCAAFGKDAAFPIKINRGVRIGGQAEPAQKTKSFKKTKPAPEAAQGPSFNFDGESYFLSYSTKDASGPWVNDYYRAEDNHPDKWQKLISVFYYENTKGGPLELAQAMIDSLKASNPAASYGLTQNDRTGEIIIDYFTWTPGNRVIEFNAFKISKYKNKPISLQFARRWYEDGSGAQEKDFIDNFKTLRPVWVAAITAAPIPVPNKAK